MACNNIEQLLVSEAGRIGGEIYRRTLDTSIWNKLVKQEAWPDEYGDIISVLTYERSLPANPVVFSDLRQNNQDRVVGTAFTDVNADGVSDNVVTNGGSCVPAAQKLTIAQTLRQYNLQQAAIESPDVCLNDLRFPVRRREQLQNVIDIMSDVTAWVWKERRRDEYTRIAKNKVVINPALNTSASVMPAFVATSRLTQGVLNHFYLKLIRDGGGMNPMDRSEGAPVFLLSLSAEASAGIIKDNADIRQDFRYSTRVNELLAPLGINRSYGGFFHSIEAFPPRYDFVAGAWVRRPAYVATATTKGLSYEVNPLYEAAEFEDTILFHMDTYHAVVPGPIASQGGMAFNPVTYRGDFAWRNIPDRVCNPDGNIGFFRAIFADGSKPVYPQFGYVFRHQRCPQDLGLVACIGS
ncbi:MAG: hypothetical protein ABI162_07020 [Luteolibacter sp.]